MNDVLPLAAGVAPAVSDWVAIAMLFFSFFVAALVTLDAILPPARSEAHESTRHA